MRIDHFYVKILLSKIFHFLTHSVPEAADSGSTYIEQIIYYINQMHFLH